MTNCLECENSAKCTKCFNNKYLDSALTNCRNTCLNYDSNSIFILNIRKLLSNINYYYIFL